MEPERRREQILKAATRVFARQGYHRASVADIIAEAGIARGTFYLYFPGKREIFSELVDVFAVRIANALQRINMGQGQPSWEEQLRANTKKLAALLLEEVELFTILYHHSMGLDPDSDAKTQEFYGRIAAAIRGALVLGQKMGILRQGLHLELAARHMLGSVREVVYYLTRAKPGRVSLDEFVDEMLTYHLRGLAAWSKTRSPRKASSP
jgi:AcrR family transcriptional regulator